MKLFEFTYNGYQAFIDVDEVIQVCASSEQSDSVYVLYKNGSEKTFHMRTESKKKFCEDILNFKQITTRQYD